jgi:hypothetical protein
LSELGFLGIGAFLLILVNFRKANSKMLKTARTSGLTQNLNWSRALEAGMVAFFGKRFFYNMLILTWFRDLYILNAAMMGVYHKEKTDLVHIGV